MTADDAIIIEGAREHNLRGVSVAIPRGVLTVVTGVSGSGKSSLVFDTLHAEGQRQYMESLSPYTRRTLDRLPRPQLDAIRGLHPTIAIRQLSGFRSPRSSVGTITEIADHVRLLFARAGDHSFSPGFFSPNTPAGMCPTCEGMGVRLGVTVGRLVADPSLPIRAGALSFYGDRRRLPKKTYWPLQDLPRLLECFGASLETPWALLPEVLRDLVLTGTTTLPLTPDQWSFVQARPATGLLAEVERLYRDASSPTKKQSYQQFFEETTCVECGGSRHCAEALAVALAGLHIAAVENLTIDELPAWTDHVEHEASGAYGRVVHELAQEVRRRVDNVLRVGLGYLSLARPAPTLSAGELQRLRIARQMGCGLAGIVYVLDEPTVGLHARDNDRLASTLRDLCTVGNTVVVVEHDPDMMRRADWLLELGPGAGTRGGELVDEGTPDAVRREGRGLTARYLRGECVVRASRQERRVPDGRFLTLAGARANNLKGITACFPVGLFTCVTGVSGSGKSSLVTRTLEPAAAAVGGEEARVPGPYDRLIGLEAFRRVVTVTQAPIGRSSRSVPATYCDVFDEVRRLFARTPAAKERRFTAAHFSFNSEAGQCDACRGTGEMVIPMHFLPDVVVVCPVCEGRRYRHAVLEVELDGRSIAGVLDLEVEEALRCFGSVAEIAGPLALLARVGLGYLKLGQSCSTLSGGEAQRLKLARELGQSGEGPTLYLVDEPTTGLHSWDVQLLVDLLHELVDRGATVVVVEHNLDLIATADWVMDLGPGAAEEGGRIVVEGPPEVVAACRASALAPHLREALAR